MLGSLPIVDPSERTPPEVKPTRPRRAAVVHLLRVALFTALVVLVHRSHQRRLNVVSDVAALPLDVVQSIFPPAVEAKLDADGRTTAQDSHGETLGTLLQTSPAGDRCVGFSGPTNVLLAFDPQQRNVAARILSTRDTAEHAERVAEDPRFFRGYRGRTPDEISAGLSIDAVSGATLTSLAIAEAIVARLGGQAASLRFPDPPSALEAAKLFPKAASIAPLSTLSQLWNVLDPSGRSLGMVLRGSPAIDNIVGYQGPTDLLIGLEPLPAPPPGDGVGPTDGYRVVGVLLGRSFDNEPYVTYVREDRYFFKAFAGRTVSELAQLDLRAARVEGVSGATMTSLAVADGIVATAQRHIADAARNAAAIEARRVRLSAREIGTIAVTVIGSLLALSRWKANAWVRFPFLIATLVILGFLNGDLVSQALLVGWTQNGIPWRKVLGLLVLAAAAIALPVLTRRNVYCSHLCPHGAAQQLLLSRVRWQWRPGPRLSQVLNWVPGMLLTWVLFVAVSGRAASLVDLEPFDAYVPSIAGGPALTLFAAGLTASLFLPMAYCRYGCPTGALLDWLRRHSRRDALNYGDLLALAGCGLALWFG